MGSVHCSTVVGICYIALVMNHLSNYPRLVFIHYSSTKKKGDSNYGRIARIYSLYLTSGNGSTYTLVQKVFYKIIMLDNYLNIVLEFPVSKLMVISYL